MKNSNDTIMNRTRDLPQPTAPPGDPQFMNLLLQNMKMFMEEIGKNVRKILITLRENSYF